MPDSRIHRSVLLPAPVELVWRFVADADRLGAWFGGEMQLEARRGGRVLLRQPDGARLSGTVEVVVPHRRIVFTWCPEHQERRLVTRVTLLLEPRGRGTLLRVVESPAMGLDATPVSVPSGGTEFAMDLRAASR